MHNRIISIFTALVLILVLTACGGGGGGGSLTGDVSGSIAQSESFYSGITNRADLTEDNSVEYAEDAMLGYESGNSSIETFRSKQPENIKNLSGVNSFFMAKDFIQKITGENSSARTTYEESGSEYGSCGGIGYYSAYLNTYNGTFRIDIDFDNYCYWGLTYDGSLEFNGTFSGSTLSWSSINTLSFEFDDLALNTSDRNMKANGAIVFNVYSTYATMTADITMYDQDQNKYIRFSDLVCTIYDSSGYTSYNGSSYYYTSQVTLTGKVYISTYGYVDITTPDRVDINSNGYYLDGTIKLKGNDNATVLAEYSPYSVQTITGDLNGDSVYETIF